MKLLAFVLALLPILWLMLALGYKKAGIQSLSDCSCGSNLAGTYLLEDAGEGLCNRRSGGCGHGHLAGKPGDYCLQYLPTTCV